jgi:hypothetical protein
MTPPAAMLTGEKLEIVCCGYVAAEALPATKTVNARKNDETRIRVNIE